MTGPLKTCPLILWRKALRTIRSAGLLHLESSNPSNALARQEAKR
jgi:hypothetical protein